MKDPREIKKVKKQPKQKKVSSDALSKQKFRQRRLLTFGRMFKYGFSSFLRNSWLSVAATLVMTLTLMIILITFMSHHVLNDTVNDLRQKVDMSIYLKTETSNKAADKIIAELKDLESVQQITYISAEQARKNIIEESEGDSTVLEALKEATNKNPATLRVVIKDINDTSELESFVKDNKSLKEYLNESYKPSFAGERRETIKLIGRAVKFIQQVGLGSGAVFVMISALIIFNTIRMAIFNRKEEIQMMKLIGADKAFIRGPFLVESMIYGFLAAFFAVGLSLWALYSVAGVLASYQIIVQPTVSLITNYVWLVLPIMMGIGALIGIVSSSFATYKFLKKQ